MLKFLLIHTTIIVLSDDHALYRGALCVHKSSRDSNNCQLSLRRKFLVDNLYLKSLHMNGCWNYLTRWMCVQQDSSSLLHYQMILKIILKSCEYFFTVYNIRRMLVCIAVSTCMVQGYNLVLLLRCCRLC